MGLIKLWNGKTICGLNVIIQCVKVQTIRNSTQHSLKFSADYKRVSINLNTHISVLNEHANIHKVPHYNFNRSKYIAPKDLSLIG